MRHMCLICGLNKSDLLEVYIFMWCPNDVNLNADTEDSCTDLVSFSHSLKVLQRTVSVEQCCQFHIAPVDGSVTPTDFPVALNSSHLSWELLISILLAVRSMQCRGLLFCALSSIILNILHLNDCIPLRLVMSCRMPASTCGVLEEWVSWDLILVASILYNAATVLPEKFN